MRSRKELHDEEISTSEDKLWEIFNRFVVKMVT